MKALVLKGWNKLSSEGILTFAYLSTRYLIGSNNMKARPSKTHLHDMLDPDLKNYSKCERSADISSSNFKNVQDFDSDVYYGVDVNESRLKEAVQTPEYSEDAVYVERPVAAGSIENHVEENTSYVAVRGDMRDHLFPRDSLDLIVSTHTFNHLPHSDHPDIIENFCKWLRPGGTLLFQMDDKKWYTKEIDDTLHDCFIDVEVTEYKNVVSRIYERFLKSVTGSAEFPSEESTSELLMMLLTRLLTPFERLSLFSGQSLYVRCLGRR